MPLRDKNDEAPPRLCGRKPPLITTVEMELPATDPMRVIWRAVNALDWSGYYRRLRARGSRAGRPAYDPRVLAALRIWGFREKVFSARRWQSAARRTGCAGGCGREEGCELSHVVRFSARRARCWTICCLRRSRCCIVAERCRLTRCWWTGRGRTRAHGGQFS